MYEFNRGKQHSEYTTGGGEMSFSLTWRVMSTTWFGWGSTLVALMVCAPLVSGLAYGTGVVRDGRLLSSTIDCGLGLDVGGDRLISHGEDQLCYASVAGLSRQYDGAEASRDARLHASLALHPSVVPNVTPGEWLSYWQYRYEAPRLSVAQMGIVSRAHFDYRSGCKAEQRFFAALALSALYRQLSR